MPCDEGHNHQWVTEGDLTIEKCEHYCAYCEPGLHREHKWKYPWFLRRHVKTVHCKPGAVYENVTVLDTWTGMPNRRPRPPYRRYVKDLKDKHRKNKNKFEPKTPTLNERRMRMGGKSLPVEQAATLDDSGLNKPMENTAIDINVRPTVTASCFLNRNELDFNSDFNFAKPSSFFDNGEFIDDDPSGFLNNNDLNNDFVTPDGFHNHSNDSTPPSGSGTLARGYSTPPSGSGTLASGYSTPQTDFGTPTKVVNLGQLSIQDTIEPSMQSSRTSNQASLALLAREFRGAVAQLGQAAKNQGISSAHLQWILSEESEKMTKTDKTFNNDKVDVVEVITVDDDDDGADDVDDTDEDMNHDEDDDDEDVYY